MRDYDVRLILRGAPRRLPADQLAVAAKLMHALAPFDAVAEVNERGLQVQLHVVAGGPDIAEDRARCVLRAVVDRVAADPAWRISIARVARWTR